MIVYSAPSAEFSSDVISNRIEKRILNAFHMRLGRSTSQSEIASWRNSLQYMNNVLIAANTPGDANVAIEYQIPLTSKRVDFILTGQDAARGDNAIIVELKQWTEATSTKKDAIVETFVGRGVREVPHPSYQAWTYAALIRDYNEDVQNSDIAIRPCAYLHNCTDGEHLKSDFYASHTDKAPIFLRDDADRLAEFVKKYVKYGDPSSIIYKLEHGKLRPSKNLVDHLVSLLQGNRAFEMIDDQKVVYETAIQLAKRAAAGPKQVLLVEGGPGTGKSVVAINLLVELTRQRFVTHYVSRNAAPRAVYESKLTGSFAKSHISNLFKGSGSYTEITPNTLDVLVVDEAHRLNEKSGFYQNLGENQVKELINAAKCTVFFIDEDQRVTFTDIGDKEEIRRWADQLNAQVIELELESQFRCNGSDGYLSWVDNSLGIRETANPTLSGIDYDFRVFDSPNDLHAAIVERNAERNKARLVAGYCWDWKGKKNSEIKDVRIPEYAFAMRWNLDTDGSLWIVSPESISEVGCIHTCQGLELDYVGVIVGADLVVRNGKVLTDGAARSSQDRSIRGYKKMLKEDPKRALELAERVIKNTYRTLMTRGQKGCYVFCTDPETNEYFKRFTDYSTGPHRPPEAWPDAAEPDS